MGDMTTTLACPPLIALRHIDMRTGRTHVVAVMLGPPQPQLRPFVGGEDPVLDLVAFRRKRFEQRADLTVGKVVVQGNDGGR